MSASELERLRGEIDRVNERLLELLNERAKLARAYWDWQEMLKFIERKRT